MRHLTYAGESGGEPSTVDSDEGVIDRFFDICVTGNGRVGLDDDAEKGMAMDLKERKGRRRRGRDEGREICLPRSTGRSYEASEDRRWHKYVEHTVTGR